MTSVDFRKDRFENAESMMRAFKQWIRDPIHGLRIAQEDSARILALESVTKFYETESYLYMKATIFPWFMDENVLRVFFESPGRLDNELSQCMKTRQVKRNDLLAKYIANQLYSERRFRVVFAEISKSIGLIRTDLTEKEDLCKAIEKLNENGEFSVLGKAVYDHVEDKECVRHIFHKLEPYIAWKTLVAEVEQGSVLQLGPINDECEFVKQ